MTALHPSNMAKAQALVSRYKNLSNAYETIVSGRTLDVVASGTRFNHELDDCAQAALQAVLLEGLRRELDRRRTQMGVDVTDLKQPSPLLEDLSNAADIVSGWANNPTPS